MSADVLLQHKPWVPLEAMVRSVEGNRSDAAYVCVARQFDVVGNPRYARGQQGHHETYCNVFAWDVTRAMGAEVPHWVDPETGEAVRMGTGAEMGIWDGSARLDRKTFDMVCWLTHFGAGNGWRELGADEAARCASAGEPTLITWSSSSPTQDGHVAVLMPGGLIAQAGAVNLWLQPLVKGFGSHTPLRFWSHP